MADDGSPPPETIFISDDDDDLDLPDEWLDDGSTAQEDPQILHASHIQLQLNLCYFLFCCLPLLTLLVLCAWRKYGKAIAAAQLADLKERQETAAAQASKAAAKKDG